MHEVTEKRLERRGKPIEIKYISFPGELKRLIRGATVERDDHFTVLIDSDLNADQLKRTLGHELAHIFLGHFDDRGGDWRPLPDQGQYMQDPARERAADDHALEYYQMYIKKELHTRQSDTALNQDQHRTAPANT